jgi:hypothetical protein
MTHLQELLLKATEFLLSLGILGIMLGLFLFLFLFFAGAK